jgi:purine-binding chemotaxis protein CheW
MVAIAKKEITEQDLQAGQYLTFKLAGEQFAIGILHIKEIIEYGHLTKVPLMPNFIHGVINLRGAVVPVIDLSSRFWNKPSQLNPRSCIVILELRHQETSLVVGVIVDAVIAVLDISADNIEPAPAFGTGISPDCIAGMGKLGDAFIIMLNVDKVMSVDDVAQLQMAEAEIDVKHHEQHG